MARVCFVGTILDVAAAVVVAGHDLVAVVGHGGRPGLPRLKNLARPGPAEALARAAGARFVNVSGRGLAAAVDDVRACRPDVILCAGWPGLLPAALLEVPRLGGVNVHPSRLPAHRGPDPLGWTIFAGDVETALTFHHMTSTFDAGDVYRQLPVPVWPDDTRQTLGNRCFTVAIASVGAVLRDLEQGLITPTPQGPGRSEGRLTPAMLRLEFGPLRGANSPSIHRPEADESADNTATLSRRLRARLPAPILIGGERHGVVRVVAMADGAGAGPPGTVVAVVGADVAVATSDGRLWLTVARPSRRLHKGAIVVSP